MAHPIIIRMDPNDPNSPPLPQPPTLGQRSNFSCTLCWRVATRYGVACYSCGARGQVRTRFLMGMGMGVAAAPVAAAAAAAPVAVAAAPVAAAPADRIAG